MFLSFLFLVHFWQEALECLVHYPMLGSLLLESHLETLSY